jgi:hypothetical protein
MPLGVHCKPGRTTASPTNGRGLPAGNFRRVISAVISAPREDFLYEVKGGSLRSPPAIGFLPGSSDGLASARSAGPVRPSA